MTERALNSHVNATPLFLFFPPAFRRLCYFTPCYVEASSRAARERAVREQRRGGLMKGESKYIRMRLDIRQGDVASGGTGVTAV